jgi:hypothetical protein
MVARSAMGAACLRCATECSDNGKKKEEVHYKNGRMEEWKNGRMEGSAF